MCPCLKDILYILLKYMYVCIHTYIEYLILILW